jgi:hypothetical protein
VDAAAGEAGGPEHQERHGPPAVVAVVVAAEGLRAGDIGLVWFLPLLAAPNHRLPKYWRPIWAPQFRPHVGVKIELATKILVWRERCGFDPNAAPY